MSLYELVDLYLSVSQKADNYWTVYIVVTVSLLAVPLPKGTASSYVIGSFISLIFAIYSFVNNWALRQVYESLREIGLEIERQSVSTEQASKEFSTYLVSLKDLLPGEWNTSVHIVFVLFLVAAMVLKAHHQRNVVEK